MTGIRIGSLALGERPLIACIIDRLEDGETLHTLHIQGADLLEMRIDLMEEDIESVAAYAAVVKRRISVPVIGTIRPSQGRDAERLPLFETIMPHIDAVDIEEESSICLSVVRCAEHHGKAAIVSSHIYTHTPPESELTAIASRCIRCGGHILKIATYAESRGDALRLLDFVQRREMPMVGIAMGPRGAAARMLAPLFGSLFTYAYFRVPTAPGQLDLPATAHCFSHLYPEYRKVP